MPNIGEFAAAVFGILVVLVVIIAIAFPGLENSVQAAGQILFWMLVGVGGLGLIYIFLKSVAEGR